MGSSRRSLRAWRRRPGGTFGYQRSEILGALVNGVALLAISVLIVVGAISRLSRSAGCRRLPGVLAIGVVGLLGNGLATWVLASGEREDINLEGVLRHSAADALSSIGVVVAGAVILATGWDRIDPLVSLVIAALIAVGSWRLLKEPFDVLMESAPAGIDVGEVGHAMAEDDEVVEVHDLHIWSVTSGFPALAAHVVVRPGTDRDMARARMERLLRERFDIRHTTLSWSSRPRTDELISLERPVGRRKLRLDDYRHSSAVHAPRGAGDVGSLLRAQEDDRRGDLCDLGQASDRSPAGRLLDRLLAAGES